DANASLSLVWNASLASVTDQLFLIWMPSRSSAQRLITLSSIVSPDLNFHPADTPLTVVIVTGGSYFPLTIGNPAGSSLFSPALSVLVSAGLFAFSPASLLFLSPEHPANTITKAKHNIRHAAQALLI